MSIAFQTCAVPLNAQSVRGVVLEEGSGAPIAGAMVVLLAVDESVAARLLTDGAGRFHATLRYPGGYRARVDRIGYASITTEPFDVPADSTFQRILVPIRAVDLAGLDVSASRRCRLRDDVGEATVTVWDEARKALEAAAWTLESGRYEYTLLGYQRHLDRDGRNILDEDREFLSWHGQSPWESRPARDLADSGYVRGSDQALTWFAPDAWVLLSDAFLDTHCLRVERGADNLVGLAFEPVEGRAIAEIEGVLWLDATTARLTRLEFRYVNLRWGNAVGDAGGEVGFERLPAGTWIVRDWHIRMPLLERSGDSRYSRAGYLDRGGIAWRVTDPSGTVVRETATAAISGLVIDSSGKTLRGAVITARGIGARAVSDSAGVFFLPGLPPGRIVLDALLPSLDSLGLVAPDVGAVDLETGGAANARVRVPGVYELLNLECAEGTQGRGPDGPNGTTIVLGRARYGGAAAAGSTVWVGSLSESDARRSAEWRAAPRRDRGGVEGLPVWRRVRLRAQEWLQTTLDDRAIFLLCDVRSPSQLRLAATSGQRSTETTVSIPARERLTIFSVNLQPRQTQQQGVVRARVNDATTGEPIPSATVSLLGDDDVVLVTSSTDTQGLSILPVLDSGTFRIRAERLGYRSVVSDPVRLGARDSVEIVLRLAPAPILLDSILVSVRSAGRSLRAGEQLVYGRLLDDATRSPIAGGAVRLLTGRGSAAATATTNDQGQFWLISPRAGSYRLQGERIGYETAESPALNLMPGDSIGVDFFLSTQAVLLAPITVTASRRALSDRASLIGMEGFLSRFERFATSGFGSFLTRDSIAPWESRTQTAGYMLLAKIPQVRNLVPFGDPTARDLGGAVVMRGGRARGGDIQTVCIPRYYLDGAPVPFTVVSGFGPSDLEAVEAYVSPQIPAEFSSEFPCGVVAYWSRRTPGRRAGSRSVWSLVLVAAIATATIVLLR